MYTSFSFTPGQVFLGSHGFYGEDGLIIKADRAVGRDDYGRPQCETPGQWCFRKRTGYAARTGKRHRRQFFSRRRNRNRKLPGFFQLPMMFLKRRSRPVEQIPPEELEFPQAKRDLIFTNDIALVRLSRPVAFSNKILPVRLPPSNFNYLGYNVYVTGWGITDPEQKSPSRSLKAAELRVCPRIL